MCVEIMQIGCCSVAAKVSLEAICCGGNHGQTDTDRPGQHGEWAARLRRVEIVFEWDEIGRPAAGAEAAAPR